LRPWLFLIDETILEQRSDKVKDDRKSKEIQGDLYSTFLGDPGNCRSCSQGFYFAKEDPGVRLTKYLRNFLLCSCTMVVSAGCNSGNPSSLESLPPVVTPPPVIVTPAPSASITGPSVYVVSDSITPPPASVLVFPQTASGPTTPTLQIAGSQVSVDGAGNIYVFEGSSIDMYSAASPTSPPLRSLPVGLGTSISTVQDVMASTTGEIFVSDGKGIAVFGPTATGNADPVRYIMGNTQPGGGSATAITPGLIAVDSSDNVYVEDLIDSSIAVFGPTDTGTVVPSRTIAGSLTDLGGPVNYILGMATDPPGNLYVLCLCVRTDGSGFSGFGVFEFGPAANGNVAPIRFVTDPEMYPYTGGNGIAVDSAGTIYVSSGTGSGTQTVFEFSNSDAGSVAATNTVTVGGWTDSPPSRIAVH
jgi:hypothetical protein